MTMDCDQRHMKSLWSLVMVWLAVMALTGCRHDPADPAFPGLHERAGIAGTNRFILPVNQVVTPAGRQVELPGLRPQVLALSPDGKLLVTSGKTHEIVVVNPANGEIRQRVPLPSEKAGLSEDGAGAPVSSHILEPDKEGQVSYTGLVFSPDGRRLFLSNVNGSIKVFAVGNDGAITGIASWPLPPTQLNQRSNAIPSGLAMSADGLHLYVALNLSNRLLELDVSNGKPLRMFDVGMAPYDVALVGGKAYVSNWGGRRPASDSLTGPGGRGTRVRVDPVRHIASEGSVSVVDLQRGQVLEEILVGLHASGLAVTPDGSHLLVANAGSDSVTVIDTRTDKITETISLKWQPVDLLGASPNALAFDPSGKTLYVCNGTQNAVAVVFFQPGASRMLGLIPTGWYPGALVYDARRSSVYVANIKGIGSGKRYAAGEKVKYNSHQYYGSLSLIPVPKAKALRRTTTQVLEDYGRALVEDARRPPRENQPVRPVPERPGEPSVFKHVVYIIKENRTYDQVLGDVETGDGDPSLCVFGEEITPNQHKLVRDFVLLDNTYCSGILSADGHQWADTAFATDYMEKSFAGFPRSYPDGMEDDDVDAMAYSPAGFLWDNAIAHGKTLRDYGEFTIGETRWKDGHRRPAPKFIDFYKDFVNQTGLLEIRCRPAIGSLGPYIMRDTIGWDMRVPDVFRAAQFIKELRQYERAGTLPELIIICLPNDHTSGTSANAPTPAAHVADNDLALGQIVDAISHSMFWKDTCIFAIEDDPQNGWDHVSAFRTTAYLVSPYTRRGAVVNENYNQPSLIRTMELMLGLPPMNQFDAAARPMTACFTDKPDFTPYTAVTNNVPLDQLNPEPKAIRDPLLRHYAIASAKLPLGEVDQCPEDLLNRIIWHAQKGSAAPYPK